MHPHLRLLAICLVVLGPAVASAGWQVISAEPGKRVEVDRSSIRKDESGKTVALGRIVLEKPIIDPKTSSSYRIVQALSRYDCLSRSYSTLKRSYFRDEGEMLREEDVKVQVEMPVRSGMLDDKLLREVCRPKAGSEAAFWRPAEPPTRSTRPPVSCARRTRRWSRRTSGGRTCKRRRSRGGRRGAGPQARSARQASGKRAGARQRGHWQRPSQPPAGRHTASREQRLPDSRGQRQRADSNGPTKVRVGPDNWGKLKPEYATCATGKRQSPIDIRDGFRVDLEPIQFNYRPSEFRVVDNGHTIQVEVGGSSISLLGKRYDLSSVPFSSPVRRTHERQVLRHGGTPGAQVGGWHIAVVAVLLEKGMEHPLIQTVWNNLPLEKNEYVRPPELSIDLAQLLPRPCLLHLHGFIDHTAVLRRRALAGAQAAAADLARATGDLRAPLPAQRPTRAAQASADDQGIALSAVVSDRRAGAARSPTAPTLRASLSAAACLPAGTCT
jgi:carbonic anhydrase